MRRVRVSLVVVVLAAAAASLGSGSGQAGRAAVPRVTLQSGSYVVFKGTSVQCLTFGPIELQTSIGKTRGILCFVGPPKTYRPRTYYLELTTSGFVYNKKADSDFRKITSVTKIKASGTVTAGGPLLRVAGTTIGCVFEVGKAVDPGRKTVMCANRVDAATGAPIPGTGGLALSDRLLAEISYDSNRKLHVTKRLRHPG